MNRNTKKQVAQDNAVTIRPPSTALMSIDSGDRIVGVRSTPSYIPQNLSPYSFSVTQDQAYLSGYFTRVAVTSVYFPYTMPTITLGNRQMIIQYSIGGTGPVVSTTLSLEYQVSVPPFFGSAGKWYTCTTLAAELQGKIRANTPMTGFTVTFDTEQYRFIANTNNTDQFTFVPVYLQNYNPGVFAMMNWNNKGSPGGINSLGPVLDSGVPNLLQTRYVDIVCEQLTYPQDVRDSSTQVRSHDSICRIYLEDPDVPIHDQGSKPFIMRIDFNTPKQIKWVPGTSIANMNFRVLNQYGGVLTQGTEVTPTPGLDSNNQDWAITLQATEN